MKAKTFNLIKIIIYSLIILLGIYFVTIKILDYCKISHYANNVLNIDLYIMIIFKEFSIWFTTILSFILLSFHLIKHHNKANICLAIGQIILHIIGIILILYLFNNILTIKFYVTIVIYTIMILALVIINKNTK